jgi:hypothetical protein
MMRFFRTSLLSLGFLATGALAQPLGTVFTYQGELRSSGTPITGDTDFRFRLYDAATSGNQIGPALSLANTSLSEGRFTADLDFGAAAFSAQTRYLEIDVRHPAGSGDFVTLSQRQPMHPAPVAHYALAGNAGPQGPSGIIDGLKAGALTGTLTFGTWTLAPGFATVTLTEPARLYVSTHRIFGTGNNGAVGLSIGVNWRLVGATLPAAPDRQTDLRLPANNRSSFGASTITPVLQPGTYEVGMAYFTTDTNWNSHGFGSTTVLILRP